MTDHPEIADVPPIPFRCPSPLLEPVEFERLRDRGGLARVRTWTGDVAWLATRYNDVKTLLSDPRIGKSHAVPEQAPRLWNAGLFAPEAGTATERAEHQMARSVAATTFGRRHVSAIRQDIEAIFHRHFERMMSSGPPADLVSQLAFPFSAQVVFDATGIPEEARPQLIRWSHQLRENGDGRSGESARSLMRDCVADLLTTGQRSMMLPKGPDYQACPPRTLAKLFITDHETIAARIGYGVYFLLTHPDQADALHRDPTLVSSAVEEILRLAIPGGSWLPRYALADIEYEEFLIRAGDLVVLSIQSANRDPRQFAAPHRFDITRQPNPHLGLGHGKFYCLGAHLSRVMLEIVLLGLFHNLTGLAPDLPPAEIAMEDGIVTGGLKALPVTWAAERD